ncbi:MAG: hypothetical protein IT201_09200 [Thermoleophilia bacterium]|nr:hypothetical protein [Thermoleophilia bacterium]
MPAGEDGRRGPSYAVLWRRPGGQICSGELTLGETALRLDGIGRSGEPAEVELPYAAISGVHVGRTARERIDGRSSLAVVSGDSTLLVTSTVGLGMIHEMAERLSELVRPAPV